MATRTQTAISKTSTAALEPLRTKYTTLTRTTLPALARSRDPCQPVWPVYLDHCFMRIILDNAVGISKPWADVVKAPATKHMSKSQLEAAIALAEKIVRGTANLKELDEESLALRGKEKKKQQGVKRKSEEGGRKLGGDGGAVKEKRSRTDEMADVWSGFTAVKKGEQTGDEVTLAQSGKSNRKHTSDDDASLDAARDRITSDTGMTPFRKRTLLLLTQVPRGQYTTYKAIASGISRIEASSKPASGCARAIGSAMRNNPFAPTVPCHRVLAADGKIGGFGGDWGEEGRFVGEKRRLLREEGVRFDGKGTVVGKPWEGFEADKWIEAVH